MLKWGRFFRATTDEELEKLAMADPDMNAAKQALDRLSADPKAQQLAEDRELAIWNYTRTVQLTGLSVFSLHRRWMPSFRIRPVACALYWRRNLSLTRQTSLNSWNCRSRSS